MDIYTQIMDEFAHIPHLGGWAGLQTLFHRTAGSRPRHWLLPLRACEAAGGDKTRVFPAVLAVACGHIAIALVDDMLDADARGDYVKLGEAAAANMASALQSAGMASLAACNLNFDVKTAALECLNEMFLATACGQYLDTKTGIEDEDAYWRIAHAKGSPFFGASFELGALLGGAPAEIADRIKKLGELYGDMLQLHDDVNDTLAIPAQPDWGEGHTPLPILFASKVDHPWRSRFVEIRPQAGANPRVLEEAQEILIRSGAVSYCIHQLLERYEMAQGMLNKLTLARRDVLEKVFGDLVQPVRQLFRAADAALNAEALLSGRE